MTERLKILKRDLSRCYRGVRRYRWFKCILFDHLATGDITNSSIGHDLFNKLEEKGLISPTDINLLLEVTELSRVERAKDLVRRYMIDNDVQNTLDGPKLSYYRKQLYKAMRQVDPGELQQVIAFYEIAQYNYTNIWDVILHLEVEKQLTDDLDQIQSLAGCLNQRGKDILLGNERQEQVQVRERGTQEQPTSIFGA
ncbi:uncharacterized protein [Antedon mediterranea]|uniref:uncharacterized protein isoform X2 n=1 Tax=Antedon mediterranea TaxID=105859 RepID=UPI003AF83895